MANKPPVPKVDLKNLKSSVIDLSSAAAVFSQWFRIDTLAQEDKIVQFKGRGRYYYYYEMMDTDGVLSGAVEDRIDGVSGLDWSIIPAGDDPAQIELSDFVTWALKRITNFQDDLGDILSACITGFSVSEVLWKDASYNGTMKLVPDKLIAQPPDTFRFGNERELRFLDTGSYPGTDTRQWPCKFIVYSYRQRNENPYGVSLLRSLYWTWWFKHNSFEYWLRAAEMGAEVTPVFRYSPDASKEEIDEMGNAAQKFLKAKYIVCPDTCTIEFPSIKIDPEMASVLVEKCDAEIRYRVLGSTLSSGTEGSGSRALGETHSAQEQKHIEHDARSIESVFNSTIIPWIVQLNLGEQPDLPIFKLHYETDEDAETVRENLKAGISFGIPISQSYAAEQLHLKIAAPGEDICKAPAPPPSAGVSGGNPFSGNNPDNLDNLDNPGNPDNLTDDNPAKLPAGIGSDAQKKVRSVRGTDYDQQSVNIAHMKQLEIAAIEHGKPVADYIRFQATQWLEQFPDLESAAHSNFEPNLSKLEDYLAELNFLSTLYGMFDLYDNPAVTKELKGSLRNERRSRFPISEMVLEAKKDKWVPVPFEEAIKQFEDREILTRKEFDQLAEYAKRNALTAKGMTRKTIETTLRTSLLGAIRDGTTIQEYKPKVADVVMSPWHSETIFRTNVLSAYNTGHAEALYDPALADMFPAFEFVAVMDDRTTAVCAERDGMVFTRAEMLTSPLVPPLHYNCRSTIVGIYKDDFQGVTPKPLVVQPKGGFGQFQPLLSNENELLSKPMPPLMSPEGELLFAPPPITGDHEILMDLIEEVKQGISNVNKAPKGQSAFELYDHDGRLITHGISKTTANPIWSDLEAELKDKHSDFTFITHRPKAAVISPGEMSEFLERPGISTRVLVKEDEVFVLHSDREYTKETIKKFKDIMTDEIRKAWEAATGKKFQTGIGYDTLMNGLRAAGADLRTINFEALEVARDKTGMIGLKIVRTPIENIIAPGIKPVTIKTLPTAPKIPKAPKVKPTQPSPKERPEWLDNFGVTDKDYEAIPALDEALDMGLPYNRDIAKTFQSTFDNMEATGNEHGFLLDKHTGTMGSDVKGDHGSLPLWGKGNKDYVIHTHPDVFTGNYDEWKKIGNVRQRGGHLSVAQQEAGGKRISGDIVNAHTEGGMVAIDRDYVYISYVPEDVKLQYKTWAPSGKQGSWDYKLKQVYDKHAKALANDSTKKTYRFGTAEYWEQSYTRVLEPTAKEMGIVVKRIPVDKMGLKINQHAGKLTPGSLIEPKATSITPMSIVDNWGSWTESDLKAFFELIPDNNEGLQLFAGNGKGLTDIRNLGYESKWNIYDAVVDPMDPANELTALYIRGRNNMLLSDDFSKVLLPGVKQVSVIYEDTVYVMKAPGAFGNAVQADFRFKFDNLVKERIRMAIDLTEETPKAEDIKKWIKQALESIKTEGATLDEKVQFFTLKTKDIEKKVGKELSEYWKTHEMPKPKSPKTK